MKKFYILIVSLFRWANGQVPLAPLTHIPRGEPTWFPFQFQFDLDSGTEDATREGLRHKM